MLLLRGATKTPELSDPRLPVSIHAPLARSNLRALKGLYSSGSFNTCSSCEEQLLSVRHLAYFSLFQYMLLLRGATCPDAQSRQSTSFNTCSSCEEQRIWIMPKKPNIGFNTCSSCEEQLRCCAIVNPRNRFQYMLLLRGATALRQDAQRIVAVSIHAPLARSNFVPCVRGRLGFQYMLLLRGATTPTEFANLNAGFQYMLLLRGATPLRAARPPRKAVSIHAPLARSNPIATPSSTTSGRFQYMLLLRGATVPLFAWRLSRVFQYMLLLRGATLNAAWEIYCKEFQYMLLLRGATRVLDYAIDVKRFQYMLLLRGATRRAVTLLVILRFQYMLLLRGATSARLEAFRRLFVSIHAPLARSNIRARLVD